MPEFYLISKARGAKSGGFQIPAVPFNARIMLVIRRRSRGPWNAPTRQHARRACPTKSLHLCESGIPQQATGRSVACEPLCIRRVNAAVLFLIYLSHEKIFISSLLKIDPCTSRLVSRRTRICMILEPSTSRGSIKLEKFYIQFEQLSNINSKVIKW